MLRHAVSWKCGDISQLRIALMMMAASTSETSVSFY
jgi:hypothetical protein